MNDEPFYFPPGRSMARRVHGDRAVGLLYNTVARSEHLRGGTATPQLTTIS
jgi:hypothetical protein